MSSPDKQCVIVRVEVEIPGMDRETTCRGPAQPVARPCDRTLLLPLATTFGYPAAGAVANVRVSGGVGYICATGKSVSAGGTAARTVYAKIYAPGAAIDATPPAGTQAIRPDASGKWQFNGDGLDVKGALFNAGGTAGNVLVIWPDYGTDPISADPPQSFYGKTNTYTDCNQPGSGSGSGSGGSGSHSSRCPREWRVVGEGFSGELGAFNVASLLQIHTEPSGENVWTNKGNGKTTPAIELRYVAKERVWELAFHFQTAKVRYTTPADNWSPLNANTLHLDGTAKVGHTPPPFLLITPV